MYQTALLLLTGSVRFVTESIGHYLNNANKRVIKRLYVKLEPDFSNPFSKTDSKNVGQLSKVVPAVYHKASSICKHLDVRVLLTNANNSKSNVSSKLNFDIILTNSEEEENFISNYVDVHFNNISCGVIKLDDFPQVVKEEEPPDSEGYETYKTVCLGGAFDRLHNGHKVLLSEAVLRAQEKLIIGVTDLQMIKRKVLWELIEPTKQRIEEVSRFLCEVDPSLLYEVVPISDPFGPTITNPDIDCIVVTTETKLGGDRVNEERKKLGMSELSLIVVDLIENLTRVSHEDEKVSSSTNRMRLLGTPLKSVQVPSNRERPYCILFRGHFMSGKSFIANRFQLLGLPVLCCDEILRAILNKDEALRNAIVERIPNSKDSADTLDFEKLNLHCLKNKEDRDWLSNLVQSKVKSSLHQVLKVYSQQGARIVLIKDSVLFEGSDLEIDVNEIWAAMMPTNEALKKLKEIYDLPEDEAAEIANSLPSNEQYVQTANVLFCNMWSTEAIKSQVDRAWCYINSIKDSMVQNML